MGKETVRCVRRSVAAIALSLAGAGAFAQTNLASAGAIDARQDRTGIHLSLRQATLGQAAAVIQRESGIDVAVAPALQTMPMSREVSGATWPEALRRLFRDFNHLDTLGGKAGLAKIALTGFTGDGEIPTLGPSAVLTASADSHLFGYNGAALKTPATFEGLPREALHPIRFDRKRLEAMKPGETLPMVLPTGTYDLVYDNRVTHDNGDFSWIGYLRDDGITYRATVTMGANGSYGQISTPEGLFRIEPVDANDWLVDVGAAKLDQPKDGDPDDAPPPAEAMVPETDADSTGVHTTATAPTGAAPVAGAPTVVDLMVLYTNKFASRSTAQTRVNNLLALSNQAYRDSQIPIQLRLVKTARVNYTEKNTNQQALSELANSRKNLGFAKSLRSQFGADLVALIRPFNFTAQRNCGIGYINGSNGTKLSAALGFSVVSDGRSGSLYCPDYSLVHELGHNMGAAHDRPHASAPGHFPYSYGYSPDGVLGTIMSYSSSRIGLFSNPRLSLCNNATCGIDQASPAGSDNALSIAVVRDTIAGFQQTKF